MGTSTGYGGLPPPHPAVRSATHLVPGLKLWASRAGEFATSIDNWKNIAKRWGYASSTALVKDWYAHTEPLHSALTFATWFSVFTFIVGQLTQNASTVDRVWSFWPLLYSAHFTFHGKWSGAGSVANIFGKAANSGTAGTTDSVVPSLWQSLVPNGVDERMFLVFLLQVLWSIRLSGNTVRRGFFDWTKEDYRWPIVRNKLGHLNFAILDFFFVAFGQNYLLLMTALPQYLLLTATRAYHPANPPTPVGWPDFAIAGLFVLNLTMEQIADSQQQAFQNWKHSKAVKEGKGARVIAGASRRQVEVAEGDLKRGFLTSGLWSYSRHPNFLHEQLNFWILSLFTLRATVPEVVFEKIWQSARTSFDLRDPIHIVNALKAAAPHLLNYSWIAGISMSSLFFCSTLLTEAISAGKYPKYREYQRRVGMFLPIMTTLKGMWLGVTGQLSKVNEQVYGSGKPKPKRQ